MVSLDMTIVIDWDVKPQIKQKQNLNTLYGEDGRRNFFMNLYGKYVLKPGFDSQPLDYKLNVQHTTLPGPNHRQCNNVCEYMHKLNMANNLILHISEAKQ